MNTKFESRNLGSYGKITARSVLECGGKQSATPLSNEMRLAQTGRPAIAKAVSQPSQSKTSRRFAALLFCFFILHSSFILQAQEQYSIDWHKISGGGGTSTNGQFTVSGTIGQPDAGATMSGGNYSVTGGFWSLISVVQTVGAPTLNISHEGNTVTVSWQDVSGWTLQQNNNLSLPTNWSASGSVTTTNGINYLNLASPAGNLFFRLQHP